MHDVPKKVLEGDVESRSRLDCKHNKFHSYS